MSLWADGITDIQHDISQGPALAPNLRGAVVVHPVTARPRMARPSSASGSGAHRAAHDEAGPRYGSSWSV